MARRELIHCAASAVECEQTSESTYVPADEIMDNECTTENLAIGTCASSSSCAITKDSCADPTDYRLPRPFGACNVEGAYQDATFVPTRYGGCEDLHTGEVACVLAPSQCTDDEVWISGSSRCYCHDVQIGACRDGRVGTCAISGDDCRGLEFVPPRSGSLGDDAALDCRLCAEVGVTAFGEVVATAGSAPDEEEEKEEAAFDAGETVGVVLGAVTTILFVIVGLCFMYSYESVDDYLHVSPYLKEGEFGTEEKPEHLPHIS